MRGFVAALVAVLAAGAIAGCSDARQTSGPYGAQAARFGDSLELLGWRISLSNLRWQADQVLVDVAATVVDPAAPHANPADLRFGLYGTPARPVEATGIGSCDPLLAMTPQPLSAALPERLTGTVCLGPLRERSAVRGVYVYSPADRIPGSTVAYGAAFPVGVAPTSPGDTGLVLTTKGVAAWRADGTPLTPEALGDPAAFVGNGYMLLTVVVDAVAAQYRSDSAERGGPMMLVAAPSAPLPGLRADCASFGSSVLVLPEASLNAVHLSASLCTQGEINAAVLYASLSVIGTHAAVWTSA